MRLACVELQPSSVLFYRSTADALVCAGFSTNGDKGNVEKGIGEKAFSKDGEKGNVAKDVGEKGKTACL